MRLISNEELDFKYKDVMYSIIHNPHKELEILSNRKILVNIDLGENMTYILLNIANDNISEKDIVKIIN